MEDSQAIEKLVATLNSMSYTRTATCCSAWHVNDIEVDEHSSLSLSRIVLRLSIRGNINHCQDCIDICNKYIRSIGSSETKMSNSHSDKQPKTLETPSDLLKSMINTLNRNSTIGLVNSKTFTVVNQRLIILAQPVRDFTEDERLIIRQYEEAIKNY